MVLPLSHPPQLRGYVFFEALQVSEVPGEEDGVVLDISVRDTGIGIKEEDMGKLFSEFDRIEEKRNRNVEGTGLGMNITKRLLFALCVISIVEAVWLIRDDRRRTRQQQARAEAARRQRQAEAPRRYVR